MEHAWGPYSQPCTASMPVPVPIPPWLSQHSCAPALAPALASQARTRECPQCIPQFTVLHPVPAPCPSLQSQHGVWGPWRTAGAL